MIGDIVVDGLPYPVVIADDASATLPPLIAGTARSAVVVFDRRVEGRARAVSAALSSAGVRVLGLVGLAGGERLKRMPTVARLFDAFLQYDADRATVTIAVGGGTLTDVAGFAAATYLRGIRWVAIPTTILGMADASIGGKTGIDLSQGKNLIGAFWDPLAVVADIAALATLPQRERSTGVVEAVKCGIIGDPALLDLVTHLSPRAEPSAWKAIVAAAASLKVKIVADDPREGGRRAVLNLGHTVGHAIELASNFTASHGAAVSVGLRAAGLISRSQGWWPERDHARILGVLQTMGMPLHAGNVKADALMKAMAHDKKRIDGKIRFVLPYAIGDVRHGIEVPSSVVRAAVEACLSAPPAEEWAT